MNTFAIKDKHSAPATCRSQPSRFGYVGPRVKAQQTEIRRIFRSTGAQAKFKIVQPGDKYEQEANQVAEALMRMPEPKSVSFRTPHVQRACPECEKEELRRQPIEEEEDNCKGNHWKKSFKQKQH